MVTEAVLAAQQGGGASVNEVARELGIDQSGASRFIARAIERGYLEKTTNSADSRRRRLVVTDAGHQLLEAAHRWQEQVFADLTSDWTEDERRQFHELMGRLAGPHEAQGR
jgi:DNA-binding MarR family transcriptional regulator